MEIAHADTKVLRVVGKLVLLGFLVVLLAKVFLVLLALAVVGLLTFLVGRAVYYHRRFFGRVAFWTKERLVHSVTAAGQAGSLAGLATRSTSCAVVRLTKIPMALVCMLAYWVVKISCVSAWRLARKAAMVTISALLGLLCGVKTTVVASAHGAGTAVAKISNQSGVIFATFVEATSGALIGAILGFAPNFLPHEHPLEARVWGTALFGGFLGIVVALSRTTWAKPEEQGNFQQN